MLSSESIHQQMRNTSSCSTRQLNELKELMDLYPYASSIVTLYLKSLANDQDLRFSSQLEKYAYQIPNRALLYDLLVTQTNLKTQEEPVSPEIIREPATIIPVEINIVEEEPIVKVIPIAAEPTEDEKIEAVINPQDELEEPETLIAPVAQSETFEIEKPVVDSEINEDGEEESSLNIPHQIAELRPMDEVDTMIQSAVISSSYLQLAYPGAAEEVESVGKKSLIEEAKNEEEELAVFEALEPAIAVEPKSFTDWLKMGGNLEESTVEQEEEEKKPTFYHFEKPKKEFFSPVKKAKESLDENKMPVSETLAQVFALQGNINKAILVYEQLILIFPEKKSFFATQIRNLKRKLNS